MGYNEKLAIRIREALSHQNNVEEKKLMSGLTFMVNGKMCVCAVENELMCRIDPAIQEAALEKKGCRAMVMKGKPLKGYVFIEEEGIRNKKDFDYWINLSLDFNDRAKASKKPKKK